MAARPALPNLDTLPPEALKALIRPASTLTVQAEEIRAQRERLHSQDEQLAGRQAEIERLQLLIAKLRRMQFGRRSEKLQGQIEQLELQLDELATARAEQPAASPTPEATAPAAPGRKPARRPLPGHLPRAETDDSAQGNGLSGLRRRAESFRRRCLRDPGVRSGPLPSDPAGAAEARLHALRQDCASGSAQPPDRPGSGGTRLAGARAGIEILRPPPFVPPGRDLCAGGRGTGAHHAGGLGGWREPVASAVGGGVTASRDGCGEVARRRHPGAGTGTRPGKNENGPTVDLCS